MAEETLIGIDIGTTSVKAVQITLSGQRVAEVSTPYPTHFPAPGWVEQDPDDWFTLVLAAFTAFSGHPVRAIGLTSQVNTHVFCDAGFAALHPAIVWQDGRAAAAGAALEASISLDDKLAWLGAPIPLDASHALSRMAWMASQHPGIWAATAHVMAPKDHVLARLTGAVAADPLSSVGLVTPGLTYAEPLMARLPGARARLVPLSDPTAIAGHIRPGLPLAGTPMILGAMDAWASLLGLGVTDPGQAMYLSGTSEVMGLLSPIRTGEPGVITFPDWQGISFHAAPTQAGGASLGWLARLLGQSPAALAAQAAPITAQTPLFLPHLQGERAPLWDAAARGAFAGLTFATGPADLAAAVLEGVAFSARLALDALERSAALTPDLLHHGGGGAASDHWCQIRADALGKPLLRMQGTDPGAMGAAVLAGAGSAAMPDLAEAARSLVQPDRLFTPDPDRQCADDRFALWQQSYQALRPISHALAD